MKNKKAAKGLNNLSSKAKKRVESERQLGHLYGFYQLQAAHVSREAAITSAKIGARARYFHGCATLVSAVGVFGAFAYKMYEETERFKNQAKELAALLQERNSTLSELSDLYAINKRLEESSKASDSHRP